MNKLKYLREIKNITQEQIAKDLYINQKTYSRYENGISEPDYETLKKIAKYFNVSIDYLLNNDIDDMIMIPKEEFEQLVKASETIQKIKKAICNRANKE